MPKFVIKVDLNLLLEQEMELNGEMKVSKFKRICVFCGSSQGKKSSYQDAAIELGKELVFFTFHLLLFSRFLNPGFLEIMCICNVQMGFSFQMS